MNCASPNWKSKVKSTLEWFGQILYHFTIIFIFLFNAPQKTSGDQAKHETLKIKPSSTNDKHHETQYIYYHPPHHGCKSR